MGIARLAGFRVNAGSALLVLAAALACGGEPPAPHATPTATLAPTATPTAATPSPSPPAPTATPTPTVAPTAAVTPSPTPTATPTPAPCRGAECIGRMPEGMLEYRVFEPGERIDWEHGVFALDTETGRVEGYRFEEESSASRYFGSIWPEPKPLPPTPSPETCWGDFEQGPSWPDQIRMLSPDGRYVAWQDGQPVFILYHDYIPEQPWPSVVISDAETCEPLFRVRSAFLNWFAYQWWLSNSEGIVVATVNANLLRVEPRPELVLLPYVGVPAPTGDGCYFAWAMSGVYDACEDRWIPTGFSYFIGFASWGETHHEMRYIVGGYWGEGSVEWLLLPPRIEFPPFDDTVAFRVARTESCLVLRADPDAEAAALDCLPDGARLTFAERTDPHGVREDGWLEHPSIKVGSFIGAGGSPRWVYVRAESGIRGWVASPYLDWD